MSVTLLCGSTLAEGQSMQSTCNYRLSTYTRVRFTGFATKSVNHCHPDGLTRQPQSDCCYWRCMEPVTRVGRRCCKKSGCVHITEGSCQKECSMFCSNRSIPGLLYVLNNCRRFGCIGQPQFAYVKWYIGLRRGLNNLGALGAASSDRGVADLITAQSSMTLG